MAHLGSASQQRMTSMLAIKPIAAAAKSHRRLVPDHKPIWSTISSPVRFDRYS
jgi:hypothetical protein